MNETANIFGVYKFNAFDLEEYKKARKIFATIGLCLALFLLFVYFKYFIPFGSQLVLDADMYSKKIIGAVAIMVIFCMCIWVGDLAWALPTTAIAKVNADHKLKDFDKEIIAKYSFAIKQDIEENGYFSARGYWSLYNDGRREEQLRKYNLTQEVEIEKLRHRYPGVFDK
jgi:hypothetical protein